jgi:hypothetical protein
MTKANSSLIDKLHAADKARRLLIIAAIGAWLAALIFQAGMNIDFTNRISGGDFLFLAADVTLNLGLIAGLHHVFLSKGAERAMAFVLFILCLWVFTDRMAIAILYWRAVP